MRETRLWNVLTDTGSKRPYGMTESLEITDRVPQGSRTVKISDDLFMTEADGKLSIFCNSDGKFTGPADLLLTDEADGFVTEISLAPEVILPAEFSEGRLKIGAEEFRVQVRKAGEKMLLIGFEDGDVMLFDTSRFLLYAFCGEKFICGYVEV